MKKYALYCLLALLVILAAPVLAAQEAPPAVAPVDLATRVAVIAGVVVTILQGVKKLFPKISGPVAVILNVVLAVAATYAAAPAGTNILSISFLLQTAISAFMAHGAHALVTK